MYYYGGAIVNRTYDAHKDLYIQFSVKLGIGMSLPHFVFAVDWLGGACDAARPVSTL